MLTGQKTPGVQILILGLGNSLLTDDGIGIFVVEILNKQEWPREVCLFEVGTSVFYYLEEISRARHVIAIDAVYAGGSPGRVYRLDIDDMSDNKAQDLHGMSLPRLIKWAQSITGLPETLTVYGVEPKDLGFGLKPTAILQKAGLKLAALITAEVQHLLASYEKERHHS